MAASGLHSLYIVGAQCIGKTTLVNVLEEHFRSLPPKISVGVVKEAARTVLANHNFSRDDIKEGSERGMQLQKLILEAQLAREQELENSQFILSDRSGIDPIVYATKFGGEGAQTLLDGKAWEELRARVKNSLVVICEPVAGWLRDDGMRLMPNDLEDWIDFHELFCSCVAAAGVGYVVLPKDLSAPKDRAAFVLDNWRNLSEC